MVTCQCCEWETFTVRKASFYNVSVSHMNAQYCSIAVYCILCTNRIQKSSTIYRKIYISVYFFFIFWFLEVVWMVYLVYFYFLAVVILVILCIIVFTYLFTYVAIYVVARKKRIRNDVHSNSDQESRRHFMAFLRELKIAKPYVLVVSLCVFCYMSTVVVLGIFAHILNHDDKIPISTVNALE